MTRSSEGPEPRWTLLALLQWTSAFFSRHGVESPRLEGELLLAHQLGCRRIDLYLRHDQPLTAAELARFKAAVLRRARREPLAYITGRCAFWSLELAVSPAVLIPRPETEGLVEAALEHLPPAGAGHHPPRVLELGTGSGAVILALAVERPAAWLAASDRSLPALALARANARRNHLEGRVRFFLGDLLAPLAAGAGFDLILSNPPYVPSAEIPRLQPEVARHEPPLALDGGPDGLRVLEAILRQAAAHLKPGGVLLLEIGHDQRERLACMLGDLPQWREPEFRADLCGHDRILSARRR
jgi:release factor glutamine methyltransferase